MTVAARLDLLALLEFANDDDLLDGLAAALANTPGPTARDVVEFLQVPHGSVFGVTPEAALEYFRAKGLIPTFSYADMIGDAHDHAFTVAKMMDVDLLGYVRKSLDEAAANGIPFKVWADELIPELQKAGWWGRKFVVDPKTGQQVLAQLGSPNRLKTIFRTNLQTAYAAGSWQSIMANADHAPWLLYDAVDDWRTRPEHRAWDGTVLAADDPWWQTHYPPNGYNCRCSVVQLTDDELDALGLTPSKPGGPDDGTYPWTNPRTGEKLAVPLGLDPGFDRNAGRAYLTMLRKTLSEKTALLPPSMRAAAIEGEAAAAEAAKLAAEKAALEAATKAKQAEAAKLAAEAEKTAQTNMDILKQLAEDIPPNSGAALVQPIEAIKVAYLSLKGAGKLEGLTAVKALDAIKAEQKIIIGQAVEAVAKAKLLDEAAQVKLDAIAAGTAPDPGKFKIRALKQLQKTDADFLTAGAAKQLAAVEARAAELKATHSAQVKVSHYGKALQAGKTPAPGDAKAFNALPVEEQDKLLVKWGQKTIFTPEPPSTTVTGAYASYTLDEKFDVLQGVWGSFGDESLKAFQSAWEYADPKGKKIWIDLLQEEALKKGYITSLDELSHPTYIHYIPNDLKVSGLKHPGTATPPPPPVAPAPVTPATPPKSPNWSQTGPQAGSNSGGQYTDLNTGKKYYVKFMDEERMRNELLASKLYEAAGVETAELSIVEINGQKGLASAWVDDLRNYTSGKKLAAQAGTKEGFVADAWLANWDVVGPDFANLAINKAGRAVRVDVGGALRFRAQGSPKGAAFGDEVTEFNTLRNASRNPSAADTFGGMTKTELTASARKVLAIPDSELERLVKEYGPLDPAENAKLLSTLRNRRDHIKREFPDAVKAEASAFKPLAKPGEKIAVTPDELDEIGRARSNGFTIRTDGGKIEGNEVLVHHYTSSTGVPSSRATLRLRADAAQAATDRIAQIATGGASSGPSVALAAAKDKMLVWVKGVNAQFAQGNTVRAVDIDRADAARVEMRARREALEAAIPDMNKTDATLAQGIVDQLYQWDELVANWVGDVTVGQVGRKIAQLDLQVLDDAFAWTPKSKAAPKPTVQWVRKSELVFHKTTFDRGYAIEQKATTEAYQAKEVFEATLPDGTKIRFVAKSDRNGYGTQGQVYIDTVGTDAEAVNRLFRALDELDVPATRTTELEAAEKYLDTFARLKFFSRTDSTSYKTYALLNQETNAAVRVQNKIQWINQKTGLDIEKTDGWKTRHGVDSGFGHGYTYMERPDVNTPEWRKMEKAVLVYHNPTGLGVGAGDSTAGKVLRNIDSGGSALSQMDRNRRGIPGGGGAGSSSQMTDAERGGSNFVFTRVVRASENSTGIYWRAKILRRMDTVSFDGDTYGDVQEYNLRRRYVEPGDILTLPKRSSNETLFRGALDLFQDVEKIVVGSQKEMDELITGLRQRGYTRWPDGRAFDEVIKLGSRY